MIKPVLLVTRRLPAGIEARAARDFDARLNTADVPRTSADVIRLADGTHAVLSCPADRLDAPTVAALPASVRVIGTYSVGYDHIDLDACRARNLRVVNTPDVLSVATAELSMLLLLAAARRAGEGERLVRSGRWTGWAPTQLIGTQVSGRALGIFGMGRIGRELARMARAFGMEVHYHDLARLPPEREQGAIFHAEDMTFLPACEMLSLNAPGVPATRFWLNAERIGRLPKGAVIANAGRGSLVDDDALIAALISGHVAAAGLDVYNDEPNLDPRYRELDTVFLLPHLGSNTAQTREAMGNLVLDGIAAVLAGNTPANLVV